VWGWARDRFGTPERFFSRFFVANYCPLFYWTGVSSSKNMQRARGGHKFALRYAHRRVADL
jgi:single-strand selective monofunctional uracil DNA glycosylase